VDVKTPQQLEADAKAIRDKEEAMAEAAKVRAAKDKEKRKLLAKWRVDPPPYNSLMEALKVPTRPFIRQTPDTWAV
jgi:hypothetical protein